MVWFKKHSQNPNPKIMEANRYDLVLNPDQYCQCLTLITLVSAHSFTWNYSMYTSQKQWIADWIYCTWVLRICLCRKALRYWGVIHQMALTWKWPLYFLQNWLKIYSPIKALHPAIQISLFNTHVKITLWYQKEKGKQTNKKQKISLMI